MFLRIQSAVPNRRGGFPQIFAEGRRAPARTYCALLDRYDVAWVELRTAHPGRSVYEDEVQVVAMPFTHEEHWPLPVRS